MIVARRDGEGSAYFIFCHDDRVVDKKQWWGIKMGTIQRIWADISNAGYNLADWVEKTFHQWSFPPDWESYLLYRKMFIDWHSICSSISVSYDDFPRLFLSLSFSSSTLQSPETTKLMYSSISLHTMILSWHQVQHSPSTTCTEYCIHQSLQPQNTAYTVPSIRWELNYPNIAISSCQPVFHLSFLSGLYLPQLSPLPSLQVN